MGEGWDCAGGSYHYLYIYPARPGVEHHLPREHRPALVNPFDQED